jgi:hypothetical protein
VNNETTASKYEYDVFVSYSKADQSWVREQLLPRLEKAELTVFSYDNFEVGAPELENVVYAVERTRQTLVVLTRDWLEGEWTAVVRMLLGTLDPAASKRKLIPLMLKPCDLPVHLAMLTYLNFTGPEGQPKPWQRLIDALLTEELEENSDAEEPTSISTLDLATPGGTLRPGSKTYIRRSIDSDLENYILQCKNIILIRGAVEMGKSSLLEAGIAYAEKKWASRHPHRLPKTRRPLWPRLSPSGYVVSADRLSTVRRVRIAIASCAYRLPGWYGK